MTYIYWSYNVAKITLLPLTQNKLYKRIEFLELNKIRNMKQIRLQIKS